MMSCLILLLSLLLSSTAAVSNNCSALLQFADSFTITEDASFLPCDAKSYPKTSSWKNGTTDCCSWDGVTCDDDDVIIGLDLSCSWLQGTFLSNNTLFSLRNLTSLNLARNDFLKSEFPSRFRDFAASMTHLNLSGSSFTGLIPPEISHLSKLVSLDLSDNGNSISPFVLEDHTLKGLVQNLTQLRRLVLDGTNMSRVSPYSFTNLSSSLNYLSLSSCSLRGVFVANIFRLPELQYLYLADNSGGFRDINVSDDSNWTSPLLALDLSETNSEGKLLEKIVSLKTLQYLNLQNNPIVGEIPTSIGNLPALSYLDLSVTNISGSLPSTFANLEKLSYLDLQGNENMSGSVDFEIFAKMGEMKTLELPLNKLNVVLQDKDSVNCSNFAKLETLRMSGCKLSRIPYCLSSSKALKSLNLSGNVISGDIPSWLWRSWNETLIDLYLSDNFITGALQPFPWKNIGYFNLDDNLLQSLDQVSHFPPSLMSFSAANNNITGRIPSSICQAVNLFYLYLQNNHLSGAIPECIGNLSMLSYLSLGSNRLEGPLPRSLSKCGSLRWFNVSDNTISDTFPLSMLLQLHLLQLVDLQSNKLNGPAAKFAESATTASHIVLLKMGNNQISGEWPSDFFRNVSRLGTLVALDLSNNLLEGSPPLPPPFIEVYSVYGNNFTGEVPHSICEASHVQWIDLSNNSLHGKIPQCLTNLNGTLSILNLGMNRFSGEIPNIFANMSELRTLDLSQNTLVGAIPRSLANCSNLEVLNLRNNDIDDTFPSWLGILPKLQVLSIRSNRFHGYVEYGGGFGAAILLDISMNNFSGPFHLASFGSMMSTGDEKQGDLQFSNEGRFTYQDSISVVMKGMEIELVKILTAFVAIDLSMNSFHGEIPDIVGNLKGLKGLNFSHNNLSGSIPTSVGNLTNLEWLDLSSNKLEGEIPKAMADLSFLSFLNLSMNRLTGPIPSGSQFNTFTSDRFEGNPGLCGLPLLKACGPQKSPTKTPTNHEDNDDKWMDWRAAVGIGYGCGLVFGISASYIMLDITLKPKWLVQMVERMMMWNRRRATRTRKATNNAVRHHHGRS